MSKPSAMTVLNADSNARQVAAALIAPGPSPGRAALLRAAADYGVELLVERRLLRAAGRRGFETPRLRDAAALESVRKRSVSALLVALDRAGVETLIIKGGALAYLVYDEPHLRMRGDVDLWVRQRDLDAAQSVIEGLGYRRQREPDAAVATSQRHLAHADPLRDPIDLHWHVLNPQVFQDVLHFDAAWRRSLAVLPLGPSARTLGLADALLLACAHRVAHHGDAVELRWLWDIHLLVGRLTPADVSQFLESSASARTRTVCARSLALAGELFGTPVGPTLTALSDGSRSGEPTAAFVGGRRRQAGILVSDLRHADGWWCRWRLLREHLFPPARYMHSRYPRCPAWLLPCAYAYRIARGAPSWLSRPRSLPSPR